MTQFSAPSEGVTGCLLPQWNAASSLPVVSLNHGWIIPWKLCFMIYSFVNAHHRLIPVLWQQYLTRIMQDCCSVYWHSATMILTDSATPSLSPSPCLLSLRSVNLHLRIKFVMLQAWVVIKVKIYVILFKIFFITCENASNYEIRNTL